MRTTIADIANKDISELIGDPSAVSGFDLNLEQMQQLKQLTDNGHYSYRASTRKPMQITACNFVLP